MGTFTFKTDEEQDYLLTGDEPPADIPSSTPALNPAPEPELEGNDEKVNRLTGTAEVNKDVDPDQRAQDILKAEKHSAPIQAVANNPEFFQDPMMPHETAQRLVTEAPITAKKLSDPDIGPAIKDDAEDLSWYEKTWKQYSGYFTKGSDQLNRSLLGYREMNGMASDEEKARLLELDAEAAKATEENDDLFTFELSDQTKRQWNDTLRLMPPRMGGRAFLFEDPKKTLNWAADIPELVVQNAPNMLNTLRNSWDEVALGIAGGTAVGLAGGPFSFLTVPVAAGAGAAAGMTSAVITESARTMAGEFYNEIKNETDESGQKFDPVTIRGTAYVVGFASGVAEAASFKQLKTVLPKGLFKATVIDALRRSPQMRAAMTELGVKIMKNAGAEGIVESLQQIGQILGTMYVGKKVSFADAIDQVVEAGSGGVRAGGGTSAVAAIPQAAMIAKGKLKARAENKQIRAEVKAKRIQEIVDRANESKTRDRLPQVFKDHINEIEARDGAIDIQVEPEAAVAFLEQAGMDEETIERVAPTLLDNIVEATETGTTVTVPMTELISMHGEVGVENLLPDLAIGGEVSLNQSEQLAAEVEQQIAAIEQQEADPKSPTDARAQIQADINTQLDAAGQTTAVAGPASSIVSSVVANVAERAGQDPVSTYEGLGLQVRKEELPVDLPEGLAEVRRRRKAGEEATGGPAAPAQPEGVQSTTEAGTAAVEAISTATPEELQEFAATPEGQAAIEQAISQQAGVDANLIEGMMETMGLDIDQLSDEAVLAAIGEQSLRQSTALRTGAEKLDIEMDEGQREPRVRQVAAALEKRTREKYGTIDRYDTSDEAADAIGGWAAEEVIFELDNTTTASGVGWYSHKFQNALDILGDLFSELTGDRKGSNLPGVQLLGNKENARNFLTALIAITSDGQKVYSNYNLARRIYADFRETGKLNLDIAESGGTAAASMRINMQHIQDLLDEMGPADMHTFLMEEGTVSALKKQAKAEGRDFESKHPATAKLPRAALVFGPKLGAFYANLMGSHGYLTMDRWFSRTINRYRGQLLTIVKGTADAPTDAQGNKIGLARFKDILGTPDISDEEAFIKAAEVQATYAEKGFKEGTAAEKAGNTIYKAMEGMEDSPFRTTDRGFMIKSMDRAQEILMEQGRVVSVADIQAILWYYEKRLYGDLGARKSDDISFEEVATRLVDNELNPETATTLKQDDIHATTELPGGQEADVAEGLNPEAKQGAIRRGLITLLQTAFHGTAAGEIEGGKFDMARMGEGTGQQVYGWGLYFADRKSVARQYREWLAKPVPRIRAMAGALLPWQEAVVEMVRRQTPDANDIEIYADADKIIEEQEQEPTQAHEAWMRTVLAPAVDGKIEMIGGGLLLEVDLLPSEEEYLIFERSMERQSGIVRQGIQQIIEGLTENQLEDLGGSDTLLSDALNGEKLYDTLSSIVGGNKAASLALLAVGIRGSKHLDEGSKLAAAREQGDVGPTMTYEEWLKRVWQLEPMDVSGTNAEQKFDDLYDDYVHDHVGKMSHNYVIFDDKDVTIMRSLTQQKRTEKGKARGSVTFSELRDSFKVTLSGKADPSTFIHEAAHVFLELLQKLEADGVLSAQQTEDLAQIRAEVGSAGGAFSVDQHEQFARSFEAYLMEGKSPSAALNGAFARFRAFMTMVYSTMKALNVELTPELRGVFDRLVATEEEIAAQAEALLLEVTPELEEQLGAEDAAAYVKARAAAVAKAEDDMAREAVLEYKHQRTEQYRDQKRKVKLQVTGDVDSRQPVAARYFLTTGKMLDEREVPEGVGKLDREAVTDAGYAKRMPVSSMQTDGANPDVVAEYFGYPDGTAMIEDMLSTKSRSALIKEETDAIMSNLFGDIMEEVSEKATEALHNDATAAYLDLQMRITKGERRRKAGDRPAGLILKEAARKKIRAMPLHQIKPHQYLTAEQKQARLHQQALIAGDREAATEHLRRQTMAHHMYREAVAAQQEAVKARKIIQNYQLPSYRRRIGKAGETYLDQIDALTQSIGLRNIPLRDVEDRITLRKFVDEATENGDAFYADDQTIDELSKRNWQEMNIDELAALRDFILSIAHNARQQGKVQKLGEKIALDEALTEIEENAAKSKTLKKKDSSYVRDALDNIRAFGRSADASLLKMEFVLTELDGGIAGTSQTLIMEPMVEAQNAEDILTETINEVVFDPIRNMGRRQRKRWNKKVSFLGENMRFQNVIGIALNMGNAANRMKLVQGHNQYTNGPQWTEEDVLSTLNDMLKKEDWELVQTILDGIGTLRDPLFDAQQRATGIRPTAVEATPIHTPHGVFKGGYYPIMYDRTKDYKAVIHGDKKAAALFENNAFSPGVTSGAVHGRTGYIGPLTFDMGRVAQQLQEQIHFITHYDAVVQAMKVINHPRFRDVIINYFGLEYYNQMRPWVKAVAGASTPTVEDAIMAKFFMHARHGTSVMALGLNLASGAKQTLGLTTALDAMAKDGGYGKASLYLIQGIAKAATLGMGSDVRVGLNGVQAGGYWKQVNDMIPEVRFRDQTIDREMRQIVKRSFGKTRGIDKLLSLPREIAYIPIIYVQKIVDVATVQAAYKMATDQGRTHKQARQYAAAVLRQSQAGGGMKDLSGVQRGNEAFKIATMFYGPMSMIYGRIHDILSETKMGYERGEHATTTAKLAMRMTVVIVLTSLMEVIIEDAIKELMTGDEPPEDELIKRTLLKSGSMIAATVPALGPIYRGVTGSFGYSSTPIDQSIRTVITGAVKLTELLTGQDKRITDDEVEDLLSAAGVIVKVPVRGAYKIYRALED